MKYRSAPWIILALTVAVSIWAYPQLPAHIVSHWDAGGQADGRMSRVWGVTVVPLLMLGSLGLFRWLPRFDPLKQHQAANRVPAERFLALFQVFLAFMQGLILAWNLGYRIDLVSWLIVALSVLFFGLGRLLRRLKRNWFFGIRTPWTVSDDVVWDETHRLGSMAFQAAAFIMLCGLAVPDLAPWFLFLPIVGASAYCIIVSFQLYREHHP